MTIASEIEDLNTNLTAAKNAVTAKGGTVGDTGLAGLATEIASIPAGGGGEVPSKYIDFYDYDGTRLYSWTEQELADATALPANPSHAGLTAQGWNWTLAELRDQGTPMDVGQMYTVTDGKTHLFVEVDADHLTPNLAIGLNGTATVDWGDGTSTTTLTGSSITSNQNSYHTYAAAGSYEVTIDIASGGTGALRGVGDSTKTSYLWSGEASQSRLTVKNLEYGEQLVELWVGGNMQVGDGTTNGNYPISYFSKLQKIMLPSTLTDSTLIPSPLITVNGMIIGLGCGEVKYVVVPSGITFQGKSDSGSFLGYYGNNSSSSGLSLPYSVQKLGAFSLPVNAKRFAVPKGVTSVYRVTATEAQLYLTEGVTEISSAFYSSRAGASDTIVYPSTITSGAFFAYVSSMLRPFVLDFSAATAVPTLSSGAYSYYADGVVIKVPAALEASWKAASGWSDYASYIVGV